MPTYIATLMVYPASALCGLLLLGIGLAVSRPEAAQTIRKHTGAQTYWSIQPEQLSRPEGVLTAEHRPRHGVSIDEDDTVDFSADLESYVSVGRRAVDSPVRHQEVPSHWVPPVGDVRIAILETATAEYLFVKKAKDQLAPRMVRPYMTADLVRS